MNLVMHVGAKRVLSVTMDIEESGNGLPKRSMQDNGT